MPVRSRSRCSSPARYCFPWRLRPRSWSSSGSTPARITPPSARVSGGFSTRVCSMRSRTSASSSSAAFSSRQRAESSFRSAALTPGRRTSDAPSDLRSRGLAVSSVTRLSSRSRSRIPWSDRCSSSRATLSRTPVATASRRESISDDSSDGRSSQFRSRRLPIGVELRSRVRNKVKAGSPALVSGSISSRFLTVTASSTRQFCRS